MFLQFQIIGTFLKLVHFNIFSNKLRANMQGFPKIVWENHKSGSRFFIIISVIIVFINIFYSFKYKQCKHIGSYSVLFLMLF